MSRSTSTWLASAFCVLCLALAGIGFVLEGVNRASNTASFIYPNGVAMALCFPIVGLLISSRQPKNAIGWLFLLVGFCESLPLLTIPYSIHTLVINPGLFPGGDITSWISYWIFFPGMALIPFALSLFPNGRLLSPRWQWLTWVTVVGVALGTFSLAWESWPLRGAAIIPFVTISRGLQGFEQTWVVFAGTALLLVSAVGSIIVVALRFLHSRGTERQQMKWCVFAIVFAVSLQPFFFFLTDTGELFGSTFFARLLHAIHGLAFLSIAVAVGFAILKYRLYDIDIIINRTLVYSTFTIILTAIWVTSTSLIQQIAAQVAGNDAAITSSVISTVVVISLFQPLRTSIENWVNERFYPENLDIMRDFGELSVVTFELAELTELIARRIGVLMNSRCAAIFLNQGDDTFEMIAHWQINPDELDTMELPKQMLDRWGRARAVQTADTEPFCLMVPLYITRLRQEEIIGILTLGPRPDGRGYSWDDRRGLTKFGKQIGLKLYAAQRASKKKEGS